jgi:hypothetical protein
MQQHDFIKILLDHDGSWLDDICRCKCEANFG